MHLILFNIFQRGLSGERGVINYLIQKVGIVVVGSLLRGELKREFTVMPYGRSFAERNHSWGEMFFTSTKILPTMFRPIK